MQRINSPDHLFHDADPFNGIPGTVVTAAFLNAVQEEISHVIEVAGIPLDAAQSGQLLAALAVLTASALTLPAGDKSTSVATDAFVAYAVNGMANVNVAGNLNVVLTQAQWSAPIIALSGALTGNISVIVPAASFKWVVANNTTGSYTVTVRTAAGAGVSVTQGKSADLYCDAVNVKYSNSDLNTVNGGGTPIYVNSATTLAVGTYAADTSAGPFNLTLPLNPTKGTIIVIEDFAATWGQNNLTLLRNGKNIMGYAQDLVVNVSNIQFSIGFNGTEWRLM